MRQCVCALLFDHLGAAEVTSGAWVDNAPSLAVSRKVGYREGDVDRRQRQGALAWHRRLVLSPDDFVRGEPMQVAASSPCEPCSAWADVLRSGERAAGRSGRRR